MATTVTDMDSTKALTPCPFCGGKASIFTEGLDERFAYADRVTISCAGCGVRRSHMGDTSKGGYADNSRVEAEAIAAWNQRTALAEQGEAAQPAADGQTYRHKKRGTEYALIGIGKMQAKGWFDPSRTITTANVDMREVAVYRSVDDGSLWVRPREEFEDGRFEAMASPSGIASQEKGSGE